MLKPESKFVGRQVMNWICRMVATKLEVLGNRIRTVRTFISHARDWSSKVAVCVHRAIVRGINVASGNVGVGGIV